MNEGARYRADIDGLRGVAVIAVVVFHAFPALLPGGFIGVDVFFVISGFLITSLVLTGVDERRFGLAEFYRRRIRRLFPALVAVLAASLAAGWYLMPSAAFERLGGHAAASTAFLANLAFWRETGYFDAAAASKPLLHLWSLGVEEQFYLTWPVLLAVAARYQWRLRPLTLILMLASFAANVILVRDDAAAAFYLPHTRAWELLAGALVAMNVREGSTVAPAFGAAGIAAILAATVVLDESAAFPGWWALAPVVGACLVIAAGPAAALNRVLATRILVWAGLISYPLYLWHWPILSFARLAMTEPPSAPLVAGLVLLALALAWLTYTAIERPIRFGSLRQSRLAVAGLVLWAVAVGASGAVIAEGSVPARSLGRLERVLANGYDYRTGYRGQTCQLTNGQNTRQFAAACVDAEFGDRGRLSLLLAGDSHAAHLYPGLRARAGAASLALAQFTADGCAPIVGQCWIGAFALSRVPVLEPDAIVLAAQWNQPTIDGLAETIAQLRRVTDAPILIVGPVPVWDASLAQLLVNHIRAHPDAPVPARLPGAINEGRLAVDAAVRNAARGERVAFVSALDALCTADGCLAVIDDRVTAWDTSHLTDVGSRVVADAMMARLKEMR